MKAGMWLFQISTWWREWSLDLVKNTKGIYTDDPLTCRIWRRERRDQNWMRGQISVKGPYVNSGIYPIWREFELARRITQGLWGRGGILELAKYFARAKGKYAANLSKWNKMRSWLPPPDCWLRQHLIVRTTFFMPMRSNDHSSSKSVSHSRNETTRSVEGKNLNKHVVLLFNRWKI